MRSVAERVLEEAGMSGHAALSTRAPAAPDHHTAAGRPLCVKEILYADVHHKDEQQVGLL